MLNAEKISDVFSASYNPRLTVITGSAMDTEVVAKCFYLGGRIDGVVITLGGKVSEVGKTMLT